MRKICGVIYAVLTSNIIVSEKMKLLGIGVYGAGVIHLMPVRNQNVIVHSQKGIYYNNI